METQNTFWSSQQEIWGQILNKRNEEIIDCIQVVSLKSREEISRIIWGFDFNLEQATLILWWDDILRILKNPSNIQEIENVLGRFYDINRQKYGEIADDLMRVLALSSIVNEKHVKQALSLLLWDTEIKTNTLIEKLQWMNYRELEKLIWMFI